MTHLLALGAADGGIEAPGIAEAGTPGA